MPKMTFVLRDGSRRITQIVEVNGMEGDTITLTDLFAFDFGAGLAEDGTFLGTPVPTGLRPRDRCSQRQLVRPWQAHRRRPACPTRRDRDRAYRC